MMLFNNNISLFVSVSSNKQVGIYTAHVYCCIVDSNDLNIMLIHYWTKKRFWIKLNRRPEILLYELTMLLKISVTLFIFRLRILIFLV